jgi:hypothetical protein
MTVKLVGDPISPSDRDLLLARRQALLIEVAAIERRLNLPRSVPLKDERRREFRRNPDAQPHE